MCHMGHGPRGSRVTWVRGLMGHGLINKCVIWVMGHVGQGVTWVTGHLGRGSIVEWVTWSRVTWVIHGSRGSSSTDEWISVCHW